MRALMDPQENERDYAGAAAAFERARVERPGDPAVLHPRVLASYLDGRADRGAALIGEVLGSEEDRPFREWIAARFATSSGAGALERDGDRSGGGE